MGPAPHRLIPGPSIVIQRLPAAGALVGHVEHDNGFAALYLAIVLGNAECVEALLGAEADPNEITTSRVTPSMLSAYFGIPDVV